MQLRAVFPILGPRLRHRPRAERQRLKRAAGAAVLLPAALAGAASAPAADVTVTVSGLRNAKGVIRACMTTEPKAFPDCAKDKTAFTASVAAEPEARLRFAGVKPGTYAIALLHDENANGKADFALGMMPKEGFGFSRDARLRMGPPRFADAAFATSGEPRAMTIHMRYLL